MVSGDPHEFVFELDIAIRDQVLHKLRSSPILPLRRNIGPRRSGVYLLFWKGDLVYAGKASQATKSKRDLRARLNEHVTKIESRRKISLKQMTCQFLTIESEWFVWAAEHAIINALNPAWNATGFGSRVPGRGRPGIRVSAWDSQFPPKE